MKIINGKQIFDLEVDDADLQTLNNALIQQPYGAVARTIEKINRQLAAQKKPTNVPADELPALPEGADYVRHQGGMPRTD